MKNVVTRPQNSTAEEVFEFHGLSGWDLRKARATFARRYWNEPYHTRQAYVLAHDVAARITQGKESHERCA